MMAKVTKSSDDTEPAFGLTVNKGISGYDFRLPDTDI